MAERRTRRRFTCEYKAHAVQRVIESGRPLADIAAGSRPRFAYGRTWLRRRLLRNTTAPEASAPWTWKTLFARSKPIVLTCPMDASLEWCSTPPLWHTKAVGGRSPCTLRRRLVATSCKLARRASSSGATSVHPCREHHDGTCAPTGWPRRMPSRKSRLGAPVQGPANVVAARIIPEGKDHGRWYRKLVCWRRLGLGEAPGLPPRCRRSGRGRAGVPARRCGSGSPVRLAGIGRGRAKSGRGGHRGAARAGRGCLAGPRLCRACDQSQAA